MHLCAMAIGFCEKTCGHCLFLSSCSHCSSMLRCLVCVRPMAVHSFAQQHGLLVCIYRTQLFAGYFACPPTWESKRRNYSAVVQKENRAWENEFRQQLQEAVVSLVASSARIQSQFSPLSAVLSLPFPHPMSSFFPFFTSEQRPAPKTRSWASSCCSMPPAPGALSC